MLSRGLVVRQASLSYLDRYKLLYAILLYCYGGGAVFTLDKAGEGVLGGAAG